MTEPSGLWCLK